MNIIRRNTTELFIRLEQSEVDEIILSYMKDKFPEYAEGYKYRLPLIKTDIFIAEFDCDNRGE